RPPPFPPLSRPASALYIAEQPPRHPGPFRVSARTPSAARSPSMQLGFVSALFPDLSLEEVFAFAAAEGFGCVELMCWPRGAADRRYAGVTHIDVAGLGDTEVRRVGELCRQHGVAISGLGYYPNPLDPVAEARRTVVAHLEQVIRAARRLGV